jgi:hypothetical protein
MGRSKRIDTKRLGEAAQSLHLHVPDSRGAECDGVARPASVAKGFVETDRRANLRCQCSVIDEIVVLQRLLDEEQALGVDGLECLTVALEIVRCVGISPKEHRATLGIEDVANGANRLDIPSRPYLDLHAGIAVRECLTSPPRQRCGRAIFGNAERDTTRHLRTDAHRAVVETHRV